jgi:hypothetical protein
MFLLNFGSYMNHTAGGILRYMKGLQCAPVLHSVRQGATDDE